MNIDELEKILGESGITTCAICGTPFAPRHNRQKTCGTPECKRLYHNKYLREHAKQLKELNPEVFNKKHAKAQKKWRDKQKVQTDREKQLDGLSEHWEKQAEFDKKVSEYGHRYGEVQTQKILASVPKIDVTLGGQSADDD